MSAINLFSWLISPKSLLAKSQSDIFPMLDWLVVSPPLKNISQIGSSFQLLGKIKNVPNHQPVDGWQQFSLPKIQRFLVTHWLLLLQNLCVELILNLQVLLIANLFMLVTLW